MSTDVGFQLRPYQQEAFDAVWREFGNGKKSTLVCMPTGTGKTVLFGAVAQHETEERGGRVLVLAHRGELLEQAQAKLEMGGLESAIEKADQCARTAVQDAARSYLGREVRCVIGSVQTLQGRRLRRWPRDYFSLIITDEAHHATADSYAEIYKHFEPAKHLGVTATPARSDGTNLGSVFESRAYEYLLDQAVKDGYLVRLEVVKSQTRVDLRGLKTTAGDFNLGGLEERISEALEPLVNAVREHIGGRRGIVFTPKVASAHAFAEGLRKVGIPARAVSGQSYDRQATLHAFAEGDFQVLCNCALLTEGYDAPFVEFIGMARPTKSASLAMQIIGRGTRLYPGKESCLILDFDWVVDRIGDKLVTPYTLICPETDPETREIAEELIASGDASDLFDAAEYAEEIKARREEAKARAAEQERLRLSVRKLPTGLTWEKYDPLNCRAATLMQIDEKESWASKRTPATDRQVDALVGFGVPPDEARGMSRRMAGKHLDLLVGRAQKGLATLKQIRVLERNGIPHEEAVAFSKDGASAEIDRIFGRRN